LAGLVRVKVFTSFMTWCPPLTISPPDTSCGPLQQPKPGTNCQFSLKCENNAKTTIKLSHIYELQAILLTHLQNLTNEKDNYSKP
jgi:hypothetical protein